MTWSARPSMTARSYSASSTSSTFCCDAVGIGLAVVVLQQAPASDLQPAAACRCRLRAAGRPSSFPRCSRRMITNREPASLAAFEVDGNPVGAVGPGRPPRRRPRSHRPWRQRSRGNSQLLPNRCRRRAARGEPVCRSGCSPRRDRWSSRLRDESDGQRPRRGSRRTGRAPGQERSAAASPPLVGAGAGAGACWATGCAVRGSAGERGRRRRRLRVGVVVEGQPAQGRGHESRSRIWQKPLRHALFVGGGGLVLEFLEQAWIVGNDACDARCRRGGAWSGGRRRSRRRARGRRPWRRGRGPG